MDEIGEPTLQSESTAREDLITFSSPSEPMHPIPKLEFGSIIEDSGLVKPLVPQTPIDDTSRYLSADILDDDTEYDFKEFSEFDHVTGQANMIHPLMMNVGDVNHVPIFPTSPTGTGQTMFRKLYYELHEKDDNLNELQDQIEDMREEEDILREHIRKLKQENDEIKNDCLEALDENFKLQNKPVDVFDQQTSMEGTVEPDEKSSVDEGTDEQTVSVTTMSLLNHEKELLQQKTKNQENEIMGLRLKVEALEKDKEYASKNSENAITHEDKESWEREISALRGKVALLERNNKIFSNQERKDLKQELERTKRRYNNLNDQYTKIKNSVEYNHVDNVEKALDNYAAQVKQLTKENDELRKVKGGLNSEIENGSNLILEEKDEIIKDQDVLIDELEHRIESMKILSKQEAEKRPPIRRTSSRNSFSQTDKIENEDKAETSYRERSRSGSRKTKSPERISIGSRRGSFSRKIQTAQLTDSGGEQCSDSDARFIRAVSSRMRQDIEDARQKLKDMGEALDVPQHSISPIHFPLKFEEFSSPRRYHDDVVDSKETQTALTGYKTKSKLGQHTRERSKSESKKTSGLTPRSFAEFDGSSSWSAGMRTSKLSVFNEDFDKNTQPIATSKSEIEKQKILEKRRKMYTKRRRKQRQEKTIEMEKSQITGISNSAKLSKLLGEYELLRVKSLDYEIMEVENECVREDFLKLRQKNTEKKKTRETRQPPRKSPESVKSDKEMNSTQEFASQHKTTSKYLPEEHNYKFPQPVLENLQMSPYRVYVAKNNYYPTSPVKPKNGRTTEFTELPLRIGDVAISLGPPETRDDGMKYQLAEVNGVIGFVPYSHLQQAEHVHGTVGENHFKANTNLLKTLRRIPDVYKKMYDRRRPTCCGM